MENWTKLGVFRQNRFTYQLTDTEWATSCPYKQQIPRRFNFLRKKTHKELLISSKYHRNIKSRLPAHTNHPDYQHIHKPSKREQIGVTEMESTYMKNQGVPSSDQIHSWMKQAKRMMMYSTMPLQPQRTNQHAPITESNTTNGWSPLHGCSWISQPNQHVNPFLCVERSVGQKNQVSFCTNISSLSS